MKNLIEKKERHGKGLCHLFEHTWTRPFNNIAKKQGEKINVCSFRIHITIVMKRAFLMMMTHVRNCNMHDKIIANMQSQILKFGFILGNGLFIVEVWI